MNLPTFKIRDSEGSPSDHEAVHVIYVRELWAEKERLKEALKFYADHQTYGSAQAIYCDAGKRARYALANAELSDSRPL